MFAKGKIRLMGWVNVCPFPTTLFISKSKFQPYPASLSRFALKLPKIKQQQILFWMLAKYIYRKSQRKPRMPSSMITMDPLQSYIIILLLSSKNISNYSEFHETNIKILVLYIAARLRVGRLRRSGSTHCF